MTLSNFDWTDKDSVRWFILLPEGHEGPYSLNQLLHRLDKKKLAPEVKVWSEGLSGGVTLKEALENADMPPGLPPMDEPPPLPMDEIPEVRSNGYTETLVVKEVVPKRMLITVGVLAVVVASAFVLGKSLGKFEIRRLPKMSLETHERILRENQFDGWGKEIFFKEYLPDDHSHIWLVSSAFQECDVDAHFTSMPGKLLSMQDETVSFRSQGKLDKHVAELSVFEFTSGNKIIPGLYELDVKATNCKWNGLIPLVMNNFQGPESEYTAKTKVILFGKGPLEFHKNLENLLKKKQELTEREQHYSNLFWRDLEQKFQTLEAISLQIEQHFMDFLGLRPQDFSKNLKPMVDNYTKKFGSFLTSFVVENEKYFKTYDGKGDAQKRNYELMVRLTAKSVGEESMKYIEEFQRMKSAPNKEQLTSIEERIKKTFSGIKGNINQKLFQVSQDQASSLQK